MEYYGSASSLFALVFMLTLLGLGAFYIVVQIIAAAVSKVLRESHRPD